MTHFFSPHTGEIIITDAPADWMLQTDVKPPKYDTATHGCFWRDGAWEIVKSEPSAEEKRIQTNRESLAYLASTDWYVIRQQETGIAVPQAILDARAAARAAVVPDPVPA